MASSSSSPLTRLQILLCGPSGAGKTVIANFLASFNSPTLLQTYQPTQGVRILEFETTVSSKLNVGNTTKSVFIELWDTSGAENLIPIWSSLPFNGYIFVINPDNCQPTTLDPWSCMVNDQSSILILAQKHENPSQARSRPKLNKPFHRSALFFTSMEKDTELLQKEFKQWLSQCTPTSPSSSSSLLSTTAIVNPPTLVT